MKLAKVLLASVALGAVLAGCVGDRPAATPNPQPVCEAAASLEAALTSLRRAGPSTPVDDVAIAAAGAKAAYEQLRDALGTFRSERASALSAAMRDLETAADQLPEGVTVQNARLLLHEELEAAHQAWRALSSDIGCPTVSNPIAVSAP